MSFVAEIITFAFMYMAGVFHHFLRLAENKIGSRPDIFSVDQEVNDR